MCHFMECSMVLILIGKNTSALGVGYDIVICLQSLGINGMNFWDRFDIHVDSDGEAPSANAGLVAMDESTDDAANAKASTHAPKAATSEPSSASSAKPQRKRARR